MKQLLDKGAPIDAKTEDGDTALSLAVSSGSVGSVGFLVKAGADLDLVDKVFPLLNQFDIVIHVQESSPHTRFLVGCSSPFMRLAEHLTALSASNVCLVGENPTCFVPAL